MKSEVKIILDSKLPKNKKGGYFEDVMRKIFERLRYEVEINKRFTGMEIDLTANHKDKKETAYIECKAKESIMSSDIHSFVFKVGHKGIDSGYFISTTEITHEASGLVDEINENRDNNDLYKKICFWGPDKVMELLEDNSTIKSLDLNNFEKNKISKLILAITYFGYFYVLIFEKNTKDDYYTILVAENIRKNIDKRNVDRLKKHIADIANLNYKKDCFKENSCIKFDEDKQDKSQKSAEGETKKFNNPIDEKKDEVVDIFNKIKADAKNIDTYDRIRLYTYAASLLYNRELSSSVLGNHELHLMYAHRKKVKEFKIEGALLFRTILYDNEDLKTGWYWLTKDIKKIIDYSFYLVMYNNSEDVKESALKIIDFVWNDKYFSELKKIKTNSKKIKIKVLNICENHSNKKGLTIVNQLLKDENEENKLIAINTKVKILIDLKKYDQAEKIISKTSKLIRVDLIDNVLKKAKIDKLKEFIESNNKNLVALAHQELIRRNKISKNELIKLKQHSIWNVRYNAINKLIDQKEKIQLKEIEVLLKEDNKYKLPVLLSASDMDKTKEKALSLLNYDELLNKLSWIDINNRLTYKVLGIKYFDKFGINVRNDLKDKFRDRKKELIDKGLEEFKNNKGLKSIKSAKVVEKAYYDNFVKKFVKFDDFLIERFVESALKILLACGNRKDIKYARDLINTNETLIAKICVKLFFKFGSQKDSKLLLKYVFTNDVYFSDQIVLVALKLDLKRKNKIIESFIESDKEKHIEFVLFYCVYEKVKDLNKRKIFNLLNHKNDNIRKAALCYSIFAYNKNELKKLLDDYIKKRQYYYNVVCWFDRVLYSSPELQKYYKKELKKISYKKINDVEQELLEDK